MESEFIALATIGEKGRIAAKISFSIKLSPQLMPTISLHCVDETTMLGKSRHISLRIKYIR